MRARSYCPAGALAPAVAGASLVTPSSSSSCERYKEIRGMWPPAQPPSPPSCLIGMVWAGRAAHRPPAGRAASDPRLNNAVAAAASVITLMDEVCAKSQTRRHVARPKNGSLARCPKTKAEILNAARSEDGVCDSSHARIFPSLSLAPSRRIWHRPLLVMSLAGGGSGMAATHGRYEKEWNAVVPILGCPRSLPSVPPFLSLFFDAATELT